MQTTVTTIILALLTGAGGYGLLQFLLEIYKERNAHTAGREDTIPEKWAKLYEESQEAIETERRHRQEDYNALTAQIKFLRLEQQKLIDNYTAEVSRLGNRIEFMTAQNKRQAQELNALRVENGLLKTQIAQLEQKNADLESKIQNIVSKYKIDTGELKP